MLTASKEIDGVKNHYSAGPFWLIPKHVSADPGGAILLPNRSLTLEASSRHLESPQPRVAAIFYETQIMAVDFLKSPPTIPLHGVTVCLLQISCCHGGKTG